LNTQAAVIGLYLYNEHAYVHAHKYLIKSSLNPPLDEPACRPNAGAQPLGAA